MTSVKIATIAAALFLCGCRAATVPPSITRSETAAAVSTRVDTVVIRDSVTVRTGGDTVYVERWRERWRVRLSTDTLRVERVDTVTVVKETAAKGGGGTDSWLWRVLAVLGVAAAALAMLKR